MDYVIALDQIAECFYVSWVGGPPTQYVLGTLIGDHPTTTPKQPCFYETHHLAELAALIIDFQHAGVPLEHGTHVAQMQYNRLSMMRKEISKLVRLLH